MARAQRIESIDTRLALRSYAALALLGGFSLAAWGEKWLGADLTELRWGKAMLLRMCGTIIMAAGCCAMGLSAGDGLTRRRGLSWFIAAHAAVWLMLVAQIRGPLDAALVVQLSWAVLAVILGLLYVRLPAEPHLPPPLSVVKPAPQPGAAETARSRYEQQIRDAAAQEERNRLARDLHDAIKQQIFAIQTSAATAEVRYDTDPAGARDAVAQIRQSAREAMIEMEAMLDQLRVVPIGNAGLVEAVKKQCEALAFRTGAEVDVRVGGLPPDDALEPGTHQAVFRVTQEALANIGRHARARRAWLSLDSCGGRLELRVEDDGVGLEEGRLERGTGIQNMRTRAAELNGTIEVVNRPGGGTTVMLSVPYETSDALLYRRRRARSLAVVFGVLSLATFARLLAHGFVLGSVFLFLFVLTFAHNLLIYWRLRPALGSRQAAPTGGDQS